MLILKDLNTVLFHSNFFQNHQNLILILKSFYSKGFFTIFTNLTKKWKSFTKLSINKSLEYNFFKSGDNFLKDNRQIKPLSCELKVKPLLFLNQYYLPLQLSNISVHNKPYRNILLKNLYLLLNNWQFWNRHINISFKFLVLNKNFHLLYFYNMYIFKVYNF